MFKNREIIVLSLLTYKEGGFVRKGCMKVENNLK